MDRAPALVRFEARLSVGGLHRVPQRNPRGSSPFPRVLSRQGFKFGRNGRNGHDENTCHPVPWMEEGGGDAFSTEL
jgi:hypothetical protein